VSHFPFFRWKLDWIAENELLRTDLLELRPEARATRYPLRAVRYWWAVQALNDHLATIGNKGTIVDVGAERGRMKLLCGDRPGTRWIGLDANVSHPALAAAKYDETYACNFNVHLPVPDNTADVVICLHVFEHLTDPETTMREIGRILKPGGIVLAGTPVAPKPIAQHHERKLKARAQKRAEYKAGREQLGKPMRKPFRDYPHVNKFWPERWRELCETNGLAVDFITGAHLLRWSGNPLENYRWWIRLNQAWGGMFPSLGREVYLQSHKLKPGETTRQ
jgi:SAM-dependent methyltransferase